MKKMTLRVLPALLLTAFSGVASAAAFQLLEQNASGLGVSYAGSAAIADNASTIFFNPAGMTLLPGRQVSLGVSIIGPSYRFRNRGSSGTGLLAGLNGGNGGDAGGWAGVPNAFLSWQLGSRWVVGLGISAPFGLATKYDDRWVGRFHSIKSEIRTININPSLAYKLNDTVSLGFGLNYQSIEAEMGNMRPIAPGVFRLSRLEGDDAGWGWNAGALFTLSPAMRVGVSYRSSIQYELEGKQTVTGVATIPARAKLLLPDTFILSVWQQVSDRWEAMGDLSYTHWSTLDKLKVYNRTNGALLGVEDFKYQNSWRIAWGAAYKYSDAWKMKFGIAHDRTPTTDTYRAARAPDNNRLWLSLGAQWKPSATAVLDVGYAYLYVRDVEINQLKNFGIAGTATLRGKYDASAHILGVQYTLGF